MAGEDEYGFFCDLETAKTMEYDKVEYYVVKVRTESYYKNSSTTFHKSLRSIPPPIYSYLVPGQVQYEVRKKPIGLGDPPPNRIRISEMGHEKTSSCCCINIQPMEVSNQEKTKDDSPKICFYSTFAFLARVPRDIYYSFLVCTVTASCVYIAMTITEK